MVFEYEEAGVREPAIQFVDRFAATNLYLAVYSRVNSQMVMQQAFTTDAERVKMALHSMLIVPAQPDLRHGSPPSLIFPRISGVAADLASIRGRKALVLFTSERGFRREVIS